MWPFSSNIPKIQKITSEGEHYIIIHNKGAIKLSNSEIIDIKKESDYYSPRISSGRPTQLSVRALLITILIFGGIMNILMDSVYDPENVKLFHFYISSKVWLISLSVSILIYFVSTYIIKSIDLKTKLKKRYLKDILIISYNSNTVKLRYNYFQSNFNDLINSRIDEPEKPIESMQISNDEFFLNTMGFGWLSVSILGILYFYFWKIPTFHLPIIIGLLNRDNESNNNGLEKFETLFETYFTNYHQNYLRLFLDGALSVFVTPMVIFLCCLLIFLSFSVLFSWLFWPSIFSFRYLIWKKINERVYFPYLVWSLIITIALYLNFQFYHNWTFIAIVGSITATIFTFFIGIWKPGTFWGDYTLSRKIGIWICLLFYSPFFFFSIKDTLVYFSIPILYRQYIILGLLVITATMFFIRWAYFWADSKDLYENKLRKDFWFKIFMVNIFKISEWVKNDGLILERLPNELKQHYTVVSNAMDQNIESFEFAPIEIQTDMTFIKAKLKEYRRLNESRMSNDYDLHIQYLEKVIILDDLMK